jgi:RNA 3'-terminal phosphate cyclase (ATP)
VDKVNTPHCEKRLRLVLRNASAYACIRRKPVHISKIRGKRHVPGLKQQHLSGLQLLAKISGGLLEGGRVESSEILLRPGKEGIMEGEFTSDQPGAGYLSPSPIYDADDSSTTLVFQSALPVLLFAPHETKLVLRGGQNVQKSPAIDYTKHILLPFLKKHFGIECNLDVRKRGFSSHGGGEAFITISPLEYKLKCISLLDRGEITSFTGVIWTARQEYHNVTPPFFK